MRYLIDTIDDSGVWAELDKKADNGSVVGIQSRSVINKMRNKPNLDTFMRVLFQELKMIMPLILRIHQCQFH